MRKKVIIIADSGAGGISVLKYINNWAGHYNIEYLADYRKHPFGLKNRNEIQSIVKSWFECLVDKDKVCLFIIACNTASIASKKIKQKLVDNFGVPVVNMVEGVSECIKNNKINIRDKNVAIMATKYTIESGEYQKIIGKYKPTKVIGIIATNCEKEIAMGRHKSKEGKIVISEELKKYSGEKIDTVVLACTLFQSIKNQIIEILGVDVKCIDPAKEVSNLAMGKLGIIAKIKRPKLIIWDTSRNESSVNSIKIACQANINRTIEVNYLKLIR